jgi:hypothetical protein
MKEPEQQHAPDVILLVARLRDRDKSMMEWHPLYAEAANQIERDQATIGELRKGLEQIRDTPPIKHRQQNGEILTFDAEQRIARAALEIGAKESG